MHFVERQIEAAVRRGEFDDLEGQGRPIADLDGDYDPLWWVRSFVQRSRAQEAAWELCRAALRQEILEVNRHLDPDERLAPL